MIRLTSVFFFFFSSRRRHTRSLCDWSSDVCSSDLVPRPRIAAGGLEVYLQARGDSDPARLYQVTGAFMGSLAQHPLLAGINSFYRPTVPQLKVEVDREKAMSLGVPVQDVFDALQSTMSALYVNDFNKFGRTYR